MTNGFEDFRHYASSLGGVLLYFLLLGLLLVPFAASF